MLFVAGNKEALIDRIIQYEQRPDSQYLALQEVSRRPTRSCPVQRSFGRFQSSGQAHAYPM